MKSNNNAEILVAILFASTGASAFAAPPAAQFTPQDVVNTFAKPAADAPAVGECEKRGMVTGQDEVCEPVKDERGFSLPTRASMSATGPAGVDARNNASAMPARIQTASIGARPAAAPHRDLLISFENGSYKLTEQAAGKRPRVRRSPSQPSPAQRWPVAGLRFPATPIPSALHTAILSCPSRGPKRSNRS
jgi:hypothetical protein